jgi:FixJ family two-component response regulator
MDDFLAKPFDTAALLDAVARGAKTRLHILAGRQMPEYSISRTEPAR